MKILGILKRIIGKISSIIGAGLPAADKMLSFLHVGMFICGTW